MFNRHSINSYRPELRMKAGYDIPRKVAVRKTVDGTWVQVPLFFCAFWVDFWVLRSRFTLGILLLLPPGQKRRQKC